jgi:uncharacterized protein YecE (DUF72 family)
MIRFRIGTSGWTYRDWRGSFYPVGLAQKNWLEYYSQQFNCVEANATFYRTFADSTYQHWYQSTPDDFQFVLKAPRRITHEMQLFQVNDQLVSFWKSATILGQKLGLILIQVAPNIPYDLERLRTALTAVEEPGRLAVEFRSPQWHTAEVDSLLRELGVVYCNADSPQSSLSEQITGKTAYLRLHGRTQWYAYNYSFDEIKEIAAAVVRMKTAGVEPIYIFFNNDYEANAPHNAHDLQKLLTEQTN